MAIATETKNCKVRAKNAKLGGKRKSQDEFFNKTHKI
jgi:hypothetical protein